MDLILAEVPASDAVREDFTLLLSGGIVIVGLLFCTFAKRDRLRSWVSALHFGQLVLLLVPSFLALQVWWRSLTHGPDVIAVTILEPILNWGAERGFSIPLLLGLSAAILLYLPLAGLAALWVWLGSRRAHPGS